MDIHCCTSFGLKKGLIWSFDTSHSLRKWPLCHIGVRHAKTCLWAYVDSEGPDQPAYLQSDEVLHRLLEDTLILDATQMVSSPCAFIGNCYLYNLEILFFFLSPASKKLEGHIAYGSFVYLSVRSSRCSCQQGIMD